MGFPQTYHFLNSKERKKLLQALNNQFGVEQLLGGAYAINSKEKVSLINRDLERIPAEELIIDAFGLYIGTWQRDGFRLSIEGAMLFEKFARKSEAIITLNKEQRDLWFKGNDLDWEGNYSGFVIVKFEDDVLGCGKIRAARDETDVPVLLNFTPKSRRLIVINA